MNSTVAAIKPEDSSVIFFPFLFGSSAGEHLSSCFFGLHGWHNKSHMLRAVFEGVVFGHKLHLDRLLPHRGPVRSVRISGGASKSKVWVQMFADVLQMPIEITEADEIGTLGAAIGAAVGAGEYNSFEAATDAMVRVSRIVEPDKSKAEAYSEKYSKFCKYLEAMKSI